MSRRPNPESCWAVDQVMRYESVNIKESAGLDPAALSPTNPREKWLRKRTQVKLRVCACWRCLWVGAVASGRWGGPQGMGHPRGQKGLGLELHADTCWDSCLDEAPRISVEVGWGCGADEMGELVPWGVAPQEHLGCRSRALKMEMRCQI